MNEERKMPIIEAKIQTSMSLCSDIRENINRIRAGNDRFTGEITIKPLKVEPPDEKQREPITTAERLEILNVHLREINSRLAYEAQRLEEAI